MREGKFSEKALERDDGDGRIEGEPQEFFLAFEMGHLLDFHTSDFWCPVFLKGGKNAKKKSTLYGITHKN